MTGKDLIKILIEDGDLDKEIGVLFEGGGGGWTSVKNIDIRVNTMLIETEDTLGDTPDKCDSCGAEITHAEGCNR